VCLRRPEADGVNVGTKIYKIKKTFTLLDTSPYLFPKPRTLIVGIGGMETDPTTPETLLPDFLDTVRVKDRNATADPDTPRSPIATSKEAVIHPTPFPIVYGIGWDREKSEIGSATLSTCVRFNPDSEAKDGETCPMTPTLRTGDPFTLE